jgi:hypothetical protein
VRHTQWPGLLIQAHFYSEAQPDAALGIVLPRERRPTIMGRNKNLHVIISCIEELMTHDGLESDQKDDLAAALKAVEHFRGNVTPSEADVYRIVRIVAEKISKSFIR